MAETKKDLPINPLIANLMNAGGNNAYTYRGYVGPSDTDGSVLLFPSLDDLSESIEIPKADIVGFADLPDSIMPLGAKIIWVRTNANVTRRSVTALQGGTSANPPEIREVGRLRMKLSRLRESETCQSRCSVCRSRCSVCHSRCSARQF